LEGHRPRIIRLDGEHQTIYTRNYAIMLTDCEGV
jgi:hypothetical protein